MSFYITRELIILFQTRLNMVHGGGTHNRGHRGRGRGRGRFAQHIIEREALSVPKAPISISEAPIPIHTSRMRNSEGVSGSCSTPTTDNGICIIICSRI